MKTEKHTRFSIPFVFLILLLWSACKKQDDFLDTKPNVALIVPSSLADLQLLLNNEPLFNQSDPSFGEGSTDDFYLDNDAYLNLYPQSQQNIYIWSKQIYTDGANIRGWSGPYQAIYYANTVLDQLNKIKTGPGQQDQYNQIKGSALFFRSQAFYNLVQTFALPFDPQTSKTDPGIPLRLSPDLNIKSVRANVQACYDQILGDLQTALPLLPNTVTISTQPTVTAANALLARINLATGNYPQAFRYADAALALNHTLTDYNSLSPGYSSISNRFLTEDIFHATMENSDLVSVNYLSIADSSIYQSYGADDLRKSVFFILNNGLPYFRGTYDPYGYAYSGLATDEMYLIRAECNARLGKTAAAMSDLNALLITRWKTGTYVPYTAASADDALVQVLKERKKELICRGLRWTDLRRLNKESRFAISLTRNINGQVYTLPPNDLRYALPIPDIEIQLSGIPQNNR